MTMIDGGDGCASGSMKEWEWEIPGGRRDVSSRIQTAKVMGHLLVLLYSMLCCISLCCAKLRRASRSNLRPTSAQ